VDISISETLARSVYYTNRGGNGLKISVVKEQDAIVSRWAGGESSQYYIYPQEADFSARNFCFRVSRAVSNSDEKAEYSNLKNYTRHLIMLEGTAHIFHSEHYDIVMNPYEEIDVFDGGWESCAAGRVKDFNLMVSKDFTGSMSVINESCVLEFNSKEESVRDWVMFFCGSGNVSFSLNSEENVNISQGDLIVFENASQKLKINIKSENSKLIKMIVNEWQ